MHKSHERPPITVFREQYVAVSGIMLSSEVNRILQDLYSNETIEITHGHRTGFVFMRVRTYDPK